jgi:hypothetical protein
VRSLQILLLLLAQVGVAQMLWLAVHPALRRRSIVALLLLVDLLLIPRTHRFLVAHGVHTVLMDPWVRSFYFAHLLLVLDLAVQGGARLFTRWKPGTRLRAAVLLWSLLGLCLLRGLWEAYAPPRVTEIEIALKDLPPGLEGTRILLGSDFHAGPLTTRGMLARSRAVAETTRPDLIVLAGDFVDTSAAELADLEAAYRGFRAPLGVYAVLGNHDRYREPESIAARLRDLGFRVLRDEAAPVERNGARLWLLGLDEGESGWDQWHRTPRWMPPPPYEGLPILLAHRPEGWIQAKRLGVPLTLAGHTHGGQINPIPFLPTAQWMKGPWIQGRYEDRQGRQLVVGQGLGLTGLPFRFRARPEWVVVVLHRG